MALGAVVALAGALGAIGTAGASAPEKGGGGKPKSGGTITYGLEAPTTVLSTQTDNEPAIALYLGRGWQVIVPYLDFGSGRPFLIMGRDLP